MDPNANLKEQLSLSLELLVAFERNEKPGGKYEYDIARLAELIIALNGWITKGGFLPDNWQLKG